MNLFKPNVGPVDRIIRGSVGLLLLLASARAIERGSMGFVATVGIGSILLFTALFQWCPLYLLFKKSARGECCHGDRSAQTESKKAG